MSLRMERAIRAYVKREPLGDLTAGELRDDLLAIAGDPHFFEGGDTYRDRCRLCHCDLREEVHLREQVQ